MVALARRQHELADFLRINALKSLLQIVTLFQQGDVAAAELIQLGFLTARLSVEHPSTVALDVQPHILSGNFLKIRVFVF